MSCGGAQPNSTPLGSLLLAEVLNVTARSDDDTAFTIQCQYRNYECFAPSQRDRDSWVEALHGAAENVAELDRVVAEQSADPLGLLDELVTGAHNATQNSGRAHTTGASSRSVFSSASSSSPADTATVFVCAVVEPSFARHVDSVTSSYASLREDLLMSQQRASVKAAGLEVVRDDVETMKGQLMQLEAARAEAEARAALAEEIAHRQATQLASFNAKLTVASTAAVGLQCIIDQSRSHMFEMHQLVTGEGVEDVDDLESSQLTCMDQLWTSVESIEKLAGRQFDITAQVLSEQAEEAKATATASRIEHIQKLRETAAVERIRVLARKKYQWRHVNQDKLEWQALWASRQRKLKARFVEVADMLVTEYEISVPAVDSVVMGTDGGKENFNVSEAEKEEADKLKKERMREAAKEKLRAMKAKKRLAQAEKAAREAAEAAEKEEAELTAAEAAAAAEAANPPANDFLNSLMGDEPEPQGSDDDDDDDDDESSEEVRQRQRQRHIQPASA